MNPAQLGVQLHCLRHRVRESLDLALAEVAGLGLSSVELNYFPGCRGNPWGDFGAAADLSANHIAAKLRAHGLACPSVMVNEADLSSENRANTLAWVEGVGATTVILTALRSPLQPSAIAWRETLHRCTEYAAICAMQGLHFGLHTQPDLWKQIDGIRPLDMLPGFLRDAGIALEYDPTGALLSGADPAELLDGWTGPLHAVHLRDGRRPLQPAPYLPALPLGAGETSWPTFLATAAAAAPAWYFLEMEVARPEDVLSSLRSSLAVCLS